MNLGALGLITILAAALPLTSAAAAPPAERCADNDPTYEVAKAQSHEGAALFQEARTTNDPATFEKARQRFLVSFRACPRLSTAFNLAQIEYRLDHPVASMRFLRDVVRLNGGPLVVGPGTADAMVSTFNTVWNSVYPRTAHAVIDTSADARVVVDGVELPQRAPFREPVDLEPGEHTFEAQLGGRKVTVRPTLPAGRDERVALAFAAPAAAVEASGSAAKTKTIVVTGLAIAGGLAVLGGVYFSAKAASTDADARALRATSPDDGRCVGIATGDCAELARLRGDIDTQSTLGLVGVVGGGVLLGAALGTALLWKPAREAAATAVVVPHVAPGRLGLDLTARF